jgi:hypothetical protein
VFDSEAWIKSTNKMPFGILDCKKLETVPGTSFMSDQDDLPPEYAELPRDALKHGRGRYSNLILVPQPSDSPNDPLNWPQWSGYISSSVSSFIGMNVAG